MMGMMEERNKIVIVSLDKYLRKIYIMDKLLQANKYYKTSQRLCLKINQKAFINVFKKHQSKVILKSFFICISFLRTLKYS